MAGPSKKDAVPGAPAGKAPTQDTSARSLEEDYELMKSELATIFPTGDETPGSVLEAHSFFGRNLRKDEAFDWNAVKWEDQFGDVYTDPMIAQDLLLRYQRLLAKDDFKIPLNVADDPEYSTRLSLIENTNSGTPENDIAVHIARLLVARTQQVDVLRNLACRLKRKWKDTDKKLKDTDKRLKIILKAKGPTVPTVEEEPESEPEPERGVRFTSPTARASTGRPLSRPMPTPSPAPSNRSQATNKRPQRVKIPDPPVFEGRQSKITYDTWKVMMYNKLRADETGDEYDEDVAARRAIYMQSRIGGEAQEMIMPWLQDYHEANVQPTTTEILAQLDAVYENKHRVAESMQQLHELKMGGQEDFQSFLTKFQTLAAYSKVPSTQWKQLLHLRLPVRLRAQMAVASRDELMSYGAYVEQAQTWASSLKEVRETALQSRAAKATRTPTTSRP